MNVDNTYVLPNKVVVGEITYPEGQVLGTTNDDGKTYSFQIPKKLLIENDPIKYSEFMKKNIQPSIDNIKPAVLINNGLNPDALKLNNKIKLYSNDKKTAISNYFFGKPKNNETINNNISGRKGGNKTHKQKKQNKNRTIKRMANRKRHTLKK